MALETIGDTMLSLLNIAAWFLIAMFVYEAGNRGRIAIVLVVALSVIIPRLGIGENPALSHAAASFMRTLVAVTYLIVRKYRAATW